MPKVQFHCFKCTETFRIAIPMLYNRTSIACPNCESPIPEDAIKALQQMSESYMDVIDALFSNNHNPNGWGITFTSDDQITPSQYDHLISNYGMDSNGRKTKWDHRMESFPEIDFS